MASPKADASGPVVWRLCSIPGDVELSYPDMQPERKPVPTGAAACEDEPMPGFLNSPT